MGTVVELFRDAAFDPEAAVVLCTAFEKVQGSLHDTGQPPVVQEVIARRLIACAQRGERDPDRLAENALAAIGLRAAS